MVTVLAILWVIAFISVMCLAFGLSLYDAAAKANGEEGIYPEPEDLE